MVRFRLPGSRVAPTSSPDSSPEDPTTSGIDADGRPSPTRPRPLPTPRPDAESESDAWDDEYDDDEYWDDEYDDGDDDEDEDDEYWDDEYEDDDDDYEDDVEDGYEPDDATAPVAGRRPRRRLLRRGRRRGGRKAEPVVAGDTSGPSLVKPTPGFGKPSPVPTGDVPGPGVGGAVDSHGDVDTDGDTDGDADGDTEPGPRRRRRRRPRLPVASMRASTARGFTGLRSGAGRGVTGVRTGFTRAGTATRSGATRGLHFVRTHWGRAAYIYLGIVGGALLITLLLYWNSGFTYDECNFCGVPLLASVSPWWLLVAPFNISAWPGALPIVVLLLFAGLNAELIDRWSKRPEPQYPDWD